MQAPDFYTPAAGMLQKVEERMRSQAENYHADLKSALNLILSSGGKRLRATVTLLASELLDGPEDGAVTLASAIELLHTATLVHDDLIDNSLLRRGMPTLNSHWSPGATVLTGDFLFARAAKLAAETNNVAVIQLFSETLGVIVNGEIGQLFSKRFLADRDHYYGRIYSKTASLFETACKSAAILSGGTEQQQGALGTYGYNIGIAFQIVDDILDFQGEQITLGKPIGSDLRQGLLTLPVLFYMDRFPEDPHVRQLISSGFLEDQSQTNSFIHEISQSIAISEAHHEAEMYAENAILALAEFPDRVEKTALTELARYIVSRKY